MFRIVVYIMYLVLLNVISLVQGYRFAAMDSILLAFLSKCSGYDLCHPG